MIIDPFISVSVEAAGATFDGATPRAIKVNDGALPDTFATSQQLVTRCTEDKKINKRIIRNLKHVQKP